MSTDPDKMKDPYSKQNMMKIARSYANGETLPPIIIKRHEDKSSIFCS